MNGGKLSLPDATVKHAKKLPTLLENALGSRANRDAWTFSVCCAELVVATDDSEELLLSGDATVVELCNDNDEADLRIIRHAREVQALLAPHGDALLTACTELRQNLWRLQPVTLLLYHAVLLLEIEGGLAICTEKYNDKLELIFGPAAVVSRFATNYRATGSTRQQPARLHARTLLPKRECVTVLDLVSWICGDLAMVWRPYCLVNSNCQHYASELQRFLEDASSAQRRLEGDWQVVLPAVACEGGKLRLAADELKGDRAVVLAAVSQDGLALQYASDWCRSDWHIVNAAVQQNGLALRFAADHLRACRELVAAAVQQNVDALLFAPAHLKRQPSIVGKTAALRAGNSDVDMPDTVLLRCRQLLEASSELSGDQDVMLALATFDWRALQFAVPGLLQDRCFVLEAMHVSGLALQFASTELRQDADVVLAAVRQAGLALEFAGGELRADAKVVAAAVAQCGLALCFATPTLQASRALVRVAVVQDGAALQFASRELRQDRVLVATAARRWLRTDWEWLLSLPGLRGDRDVVLAAVSQDWHALEFAAEAFHADTEVVTAALEQSGAALQFASATLKAEHATVLQALARDGTALRFAMKRLRADFDIVHAAILQDGLALEYASQNLRDNPCIVSMAVRCSGAASLPFASARLRCDPALIELAARRCHWWHLFSHGSPDYAWLLQAHPKLASDRDVVLVAVQREGRRALLAAAKELQADDKIVAEAEASDAERQQSSRRWLQHALTAII